MMTRHVPVQHRGRAAHCKVHPRARKAAPGPTPQHLGRLALPRGQPASLLTFSPSRQATPASTAHVWRGPVAGGRAPLDTSRGAAQGGTPRSEPWESVRVTRPRRGERE